MLVSDRKTFVDFSGLFDILPEKVNFGPRANYDSWGVVELVVDFGAAGHHLSELIERQLWVELLLDQSHVL